MIRIDADLGAVITLGALTFDGVKILEHDRRLDAALQTAAARLRATAGAAAAQTLVRQMYRRVGIDPTKTRPSSEALLRRVRRGEDLPRVNTLVDICNWCSVEGQLPFGLYDLDRIRGAVVLRRGRPDEQYAGIRKDVVHLAGRPTLCDDEGAFGNPTSDSTRTMITAATRRALVVIFAPRELERARLDATVALTSERIAEYTNGVETGRWIC